MGTVEKRALRLRRMGNIQRSLLTAVAVTGTLTVAAMAPNVLQVLGQLSGNKRKFSYRLQSVAGRLAEKRYVRFVTNNGKKHLEITDAGRTALSREVTGSRAQRKQRWDKRWRVVLFDIPERYRSRRNQLRYLMEQYGFTRLQDSVWVYPYNCEDIVTLLKTDLHLGGSVLYLVVEQIENDAALKRHFGLK